MLDLFEALILGIVQGLTEFLPVSSSGHLEIFKFILNDDSLAEQSMLTTVFLHFATALATLFVFRKDVSSIIRNLFSTQLNKDHRFSFYIIVSMIPAAFVGFFLNDFIEQFFNKQLLLVGLMLLVTAAILLLSERIKTNTKDLNMGRSFLIGISQAIAVLPGISRSGATIGTSLLLGIEKEAAARFSFLMVVPLILGKIAKDMLSGDFMMNMPSFSYLCVGFIASFISGVIACKWMIKIVKKSKLSWFAYYCFILGISIIAFTFFIK